MSIDKGREKYGGQRKQRIMFTYDLLTTPE
jgi:hypothetical protein